MKQKQIKEIARIIKKIRYLPNAWELPLLNDLAKKLADCFEKEDKKIKEQQIKTHGKANYNKFIVSFPRFNRKQFKEWCGVQE